MNRYKELKVWQEEVEMAVDIYNITKKFPPKELYGLTSQLRRACVSVSINIAEDAGRGTHGDFKHFLDISNASACEIETQLMIANKLKYINSTYNELLIRIELIRNI